MEIKNGVTVHRIWNPLHDAELMGVFQYENDAEVFCKAAIERQPENCVLAYVNHYDGKMHLFPKKEPDAKG